MEAVEETTAQQEPKRKPVVKVQVVRGNESADLPTPASVSDPRDKRADQIFRENNVLKPPYDPRRLLQMWEDSSALNPNIQAYQTNIDSFGYKLVSRFDFTKQEGFELIRDAIWSQRWQATMVEDPQDLEEDEQQHDMLDLFDGSDPTELMPADEEVAAIIERLEIRARLEKVKLRSFFDCVNPQGSFESLRTDTRQSLEITGNAYWEVLRDKRGKLSRFVHVPPSYVRCTALDKAPVLIDDMVWGVLGFEVVKQPRFFRRYVQVIDSSNVWFKEFGDPRVISRNTGRIYADMNAFDRDASEGDQPATEMLHFKVSCTGEAYGIPRWTGATLAVKGSRATDEVNFLYFDNKGIPPLALLVRGASLDEDSITRIRDYIDEQIKGRNNFHSILIIEAEEDPMFGSTAGGDIKFERLTEVQQGDALFQKYDERNTDKVGSSFRMPRLIRGEVKDFNRATAMASLRFADEQVFDPLRNEFDSWVNRVLLPELGVWLWLFQSLGPRAKDPDRMADIVTKLVKAAIITPNEGRDIAGELLGRDLDPIDAAWANQPMEVTLSQMKFEGTAEVTTPEEDEELPEAPHEVPTEDDGLDEVIVAPPLGDEDRPLQEVQQRHNIPHVMDPDYDGSESLF